MKTCPYCAEEIQPAAIVCKHCQRPLTTPVPRSTGSGRPWLIVAGLAVAVCLISAGLIVAASLLIYYGDDHQRYLAFKAQRDAWHRNCDAYIHEPESTIGAACTEELNALVTYGKRQGWNR